MNFPDDIPFLVIIIVFLTLVILVLRHFVKPKRKVATGNNSKVAKTSPSVMSKNLFMAVAAILISAALPAGYMIEFVTAYGNDRYAGAGIALAVGMLLVGLIWLIYGFSFSKPRHYAFSKALKASAIITAVFALLELVYLSYKSRFTIFGNDEDLYYTYFGNNGIPYIPIFILLSVLSIGLGVAYLFGKKIK